MSEFRFPKTIEIKDQSGENREYIISKFTTITGRDIIAKYMLSSIPKVGEYNENKNAMFDLMKFVAVIVGDKEQKLVTEALIDNHVPDWETLVLLEKEMLKYNCSFFENGQASIFLKGLAQMGQEKITKTLTGLLGQLSEKV